MLRLIRLLARLEYGVFLFCDRKRAQAEVEGKPELAVALRKQAAQELGHHLLLKKMAGGFERYASAQEPYQYSQMIHAESQPVEKDLVSEHWSPEGISRRYLSARIWFAGQRACDLDWPNALAAMAVGESASASFYSWLAKLAPAFYTETFELIAQDEREHKDSLLSCLEQLSPSETKRLIRKWRLRGWLGLIALSADLTWLQANTVFKKAPNLSDYFLLRRQRDQ